MSSALANITVTLKDSFGNTVAGITPTYSATDTGSTNTYGTCSASDANSDTQIATPVIVDDSLLNFTSTQSTLRSPQVYLTNENRHVGYDRVNSGTLTTWASFLVIKTTLR